VSTTVDPGPAPSLVARRSSWGPKSWAFVACLFLAGSGLFRYQQDRRFDVDKSYHEDCPFPLKTLPLEFTGWKATDEGEKSLDPLTLRITGASDHITRTYVDELTGVTLQVLVLFGPAEPVLPHTPQVCYPACGFVPTEDSSHRTVTMADGQKAVFQSAVFAKAGGRSVVREVAYHSFRLEGPWSPDIAQGRKFPRRNPGVFKVQVQRRVVDGERRDRDDPVEHFLAELLPEIDRRVAQGRASKPAGPNATAAAAPETQ